MSLLESDYFLLYHGVHFDAEKGILTLNIEKIEEKELELFALLLVISRKSFNTFTSLPSFASLCKSLQCQTPKNLDALYALQAGIISVLCKEHRATDYAVLHQSFQTLLHEDILKKEQYQKLISLFAYEEKKELVQERSTATFSFQEEKKALLIQVSLLEEITKERKVLHDIRNFLEAQKFSVGITGVMNAGKSTMVNALMGKEVLGTSVVPETANLTLLQYAKKPSASVVYWNKREWEKIVTSAKAFDAMQDFVTETVDRFPHNLESYIQEESRQEEIDVGQLPAYTSAEHSGKKCNLVKYVLLKTDLLYLRDGVEIVDTPGLDDPVIQREEITKTYIARCDMLLHLMNVSQSATKKDIDFLIDAVLYQNVSKVLVIITRADTVSKEALDEVIAHTKNAIEATLKEQSKAYRIQEILKRIEFLAISGQNALLCKLEKAKAKALGLTLENTGFSALEHALQETLFGSTSQKSQLLIHSAKQKVLTFIEAKQEVLQDELLLLDKSKEELEKQWVAFFQEKTFKEEMFKKIREDVLAEKEYLHEHLNALEHFFSSEFHALQTLLRERVVSDVRYAYETTKKIPESARSEVIIETAFKDGIIDIVRDYRYKVFQKFEEIDERYRVKYKNFGLENKNIVNVETLFGEDFTSGFLIQNNKLFVQRIQEAITASKAKTLPALDLQIKAIVQQRFVAVEEEIREILVQKIEHFIKIFMEGMESPLDEAEKKLRQDEMRLQTYLKRVDKEGSAEHLALQFHEKIKKLDGIAEEVLRGGQYV